MSRRRESQLSKTRSIRWKNKDSTKLSRNYGNNLDICIKILEAKALKVKLDPDFETAEKTSAKSFNLDTTMAVSTVENFRQALFPVIETTSPSAISKPTARFLVIDPFFAP